MSKHLVRVLQLGVGEGGIDLDAMLDASQRPVAFYAWTMGPPPDLDKGEEPKTVIPLGPLTWPELLERVLRPGGWLEGKPEQVHPAIADLVRQELPAASAAAQARWATALDAAKPAT